MLVSFFFCLFVLASCNQKQKLGAEEIYLGGKVIEKDDQILIEGKSNLLPGSRVNGEVIVDKDHVIADTTEIIGKNGQFQMTMEHHRYGEAEVIVTFDLAGVQDEEIIEHYGERGENLKGPFVYEDEDWNGQRKIAVVSVSLSKDDDTDSYTFATPEWKDLPDDYGDPQVWIEVDEITLDNDFFYLQGRTNLLEGSKIRGYYAGNRGETTIMPDGTFDMEVDYKYAEDEHFTLTFNPSIQWDSIRENYGRDGEKLVGRFVEASGRSQQIEVVIDYEHE